MLSPESAPRLVELDAPAPPRLRTLLVLVALLAAGCGEPRESASGAASGVPSGSRAGTAPGITSGTASSTAAAGCFPVEGRTVRWIVPTSPGGGQDVASRLLEPFFQRAIGAQIVIENRVGGGGTRGARTIHDADPDGRTLGIINATGRLVAELSGDRSGLHPLNDFTVLGRIMVEDPVWMVGRGSPFERVEDLWDDHSEDHPKEGPSTPIVMGITDVGGSGFVFASVAAELLGLDVRYLLGYAGGREYALGLIRAEFDIGGFSFESMRDQVEAGDLIPILQIAGAPVAEHPALAGVPLLAGPDGLVRRRAAAPGSAAAAIAQAEALAELFEFGRVVVAPPELPEPVGRCLADRLAEVAADPEFLAAAARAHRTIRFATAAELVADLGAWSEGGRQLAPILRRHLATARRGASEG